MPALIELFVADTFVAPEPTSQRLVLTNDQDPRQVDVTHCQVVELVFPKFVDGRAYSQAQRLRQRLGFQGHIRATGEVLVDQLLLMQRCGFSQAVLRADQSLSVAQRVLSQFSGFYQGDVREPTPRFVSATRVTP